MNLLNRTKFYLKKPHNVIFIVLSLTLAYLTVLPMISIVIDTITVHASEVMRISGKAIGDFTTYHWKKVMFDAGSVNILYIFVSRKSCRHFLYSPILCLPGH